MIHLTTSTCLQQQICMRGTARHLETVWTNCDIVSSWIDVEMKIKVLSNIIHIIHYDFLLS